METIEGNKLIAEFMGWEANRYSHLPNRLHRTDDKNVEWSTDINNLMYHSSWDWLMPVLEKIAATKEYFFEVSLKTCVVRATNGQRSPDVYGTGNTTIEACWEAVTEFIDWYNATDYLRATTQHTKPQPNAK